MSQKESVKTFIARQHDYLNCFKSAAGERVLMDLRAAFGRRSSFVAGDPQATAFNEGQRSVFLRIENMMRAAKNPKVQEDLLNYINDEEEE